MDISRWIKERRMISSLNMVALGELSGLSHASISRIESGQLKPTIETIIKIVEAIQADEFDLFSTLTGEDFPPLNSSNGNYITYEDLILFDKFLALYPEEAFKLLSDLIQLFMVKKYDFKWEEAGIAYVSPERVPMILVNSPIITSIEYPKDMPEEVIYDTLFSHGMILPKDFTFYVRKRIGFFYQNEPASYERKIYYKNMNLNPEYPSEPIGRMNFKTLLDLDRLFSNVDHEIFFMGWQAAKFERITSFKSQKLFQISQSKVWTNLILISRWITSNKMGDNWIQEFRSIIEKTKTL